MSGKEKIFVTKSSMPTYEEYIKELEPVWDSRWLSNRGEASVKFENMLKEYLKTENVYLFANGHLALELAINALYMSGEVITTPYTHCSTTHAIVRNGLTPVFVDVKEDDYTINPELIEAAITDKTVAIVATHVYGFICDVYEIDKIAKKYNLKVIYDAAHAFGVTYKGIGVGDFGDASMFSTHATKVFHTIEGGIVTYKDEKLFAAMKHLVNFGFTNPESVDYVGTNARMNEFEAVMGICNLRHFEEELTKRQSIAERYYERLDNIAGVKLSKPDKDLNWNYAYFPALFDGYKEDRDEVKAKLEAENIFPRKYFYPIVNQMNCYKNEYGTVRVPVAEHIASCVLTLPMYADMTIQDVDRICDTILN